MPLERDHYCKSPEALLVGLAGKGDSSAFAELMRRRQSWVRNLLRRCCGEAALADDLAQQVFMQAWRRIRHLRQPHGFGAWLKRVAINAWLQHLRKNDALDGAGKYDEVATAPRDGTALAMDLDRALTQLPGQVRLCVVLAYHERMTHGEIAAFTDLPLGTVKSHIRRGSQRLQQLLSAYGDSNCVETSP